MPETRNQLIAIARGRSKEAHFLNETRARLTAHVGVPNTLQQILIERLAMTLLRIELMDVRGLKDANLVDRQAADYRRLQDSAATLLARLGLETVPPGAGIAA